MTKLLVIKHNIYIIQASVSYCFTVTVVTLTHTNPLVLPSSRNHTLKNKNISQSPIILPVSYNIVAAHTPWYAPVVE